MASEIQGLIDTGKRRLKKEYTMNAKKDIEQDIEHDSHQMVKLIECLEQQMFSGTVMFIIDMADGRIGNRKIESRVLKQHINIDDIDLSMIRK